MNEAANNAATGAARPDDAQLLAAYREMADLSRAMLAAAAERDWEALAGQEERQDLLFARLRQLDAGSARPPEVLRRQQALIEDILASQSSRRALAQAWRAEVAAQLDSADAARRVAQAYR